MKHLNPSGVAQADEDQGPEIDKSPTKKRSEQETRLGVLQNGCALHGAVILLIARSKTPKELRLPARQRAVSVFWGGAQQGQGSVSHMSGVR